MTRGTTLQIAPEILRPLLESARRCWPGLRVRDEEFAAFLQARRPPQAKEPSWPNELWATDLFLACACIAGEEAAIASLQRCAAAVAKDVVGKHPGLGLRAPDLCQALLRRMLVAEGKPPKLEQYGGRGPLGGFLRVAANRLALNEAAAVRHDQPLDDLLAAERAVGDGGEIERIKQIYRPAFEAALRQSVRALGPRERSLLRLHFFERLTCEQLAALYNVHTSTAWRWLERITSRVRTEVVERLVVELQVDPAEIESIVRLVSSHLHESLRDALATATKRA